MKIISITLLLTLVFLNIKHGWDAFQPPAGDQAKLMGDLGISEKMMPYFGVFSIAVGIMILFPQTFFLGNLLNSITIVLIMALSLRIGNVSLAVLEIPFLVMPLLLIWLKHPFPQLLD